MWNGLFLDLIWIIVIIVVGVIFGVYDWSKVVKIVVFKGI